MLKLIYNDLYKSMLTTVKASECAGSLSARQGLSHGNLCKFLLLALATPATRSLVQQALLQLQPYMYTLIFFALHFTACAFWIGKKSALNHDIW